jgi:hypothetical protein
MRALLMEIAGALLFLLVWAALAAVIYCLG